MNYPLISEYIESIRAAEDNFAVLNYLRPVLDDEGNPVMSSGNFAVVFKMRDERTGKLHAVKCFLKEQEGRAEAYRMIAEELEYVSSTFLTPIKYLDKELFVDTNASDESEFPVLLMDWVEGQTLDKYIREHIDDQYELSLLAYQFSRLAMWLMPQPFAHGDLKPDNILVREDGTLVLVDYDGMFVPAMKGQKARELGSPDFRHPSRTENDFDEHIDDFSLASILLSLKAVSLEPELMDKNAETDHLLFSEKDFRDISQCKLLHELFPSDDIDLNRLYSLFMLCLVKSSLPVSLNMYFSLVRPKNKTKHNIPYLLKRAAHGDVNSQYKLGVCYKDGDGVEKDYHEAVKWFTKAAESNHAKALRALGICYFNGEGVDNNYEKALSIFEQAELYYNKDEICTLLEYKVSALEKIGRYKECVPILKEYTQSGKGCRKCTLLDGYNQTERCCPWMLTHLGYYYENGRVIEKDYVKAVECYTKSAEQGSSVGQIRLGTCYYYGHGVEKNYSKAVEWYTKSAEQGSSAGQWLLGTCYYEGKGVEKNFTKAVEWLTKSAEQDDKQAQLKLFKLYGEKQDYNNAVTWLKKAAEHHEIDAEYLNFMGLFYEKKNDYQESVKWYQKAAVKNDAKAQYKLALFYGLGKGVEENLGLSKEWLKKSAEQGYNDAFNLLNNSEEESLSTEVTDEDMANAWVDEYGVKYSADRKRLLKAPNELINYSVREGTVVICDEAFSMNVSLSSITIPHSVIQIGDYAFKGCSNITSIPIPFMVLSIGTGAFMDCSRLESFFIPDGTPCLESISDKMFEGCDTLSYVNILRSVTNIGNYAFHGCTNLTEVIIPDSVTNIGRFAFRGCSKLTNIFIPDSIIEIGEGVFKDCSNLSSINIPYGSKKKFGNLLCEYKYLLWELIN